MKVSLNKPTLTSIHSLSVGTSKDDVRPVLTRIALKREGDSLRAIVTDRYIVLTGVYKEVVFEDWADDDEILIDPTALKSVVDMRKRDRLDTIPTDIFRSENGHVHAQLNGITNIHLGADSTSFPPVMKLFPTGEPNGSGAMNLRPDFLAKLAKVLPPVARPQRERIWRFEFRSIEGSNKPQPVYAQYSDGDSYKLEALIQPAMMR